MQAHAECGNGVTWSLELRRGGTRQRLASGEAQRGEASGLGPFERVRVQPDDLVSLLIGPREGNTPCDLTDVDLAHAATNRKWSLTDDVSGSVLAANPHADGTGMALSGIFTPNPRGGAGNETVIPTGSLLARWQAAEQPAERRQLAKQLQKLLTSPPPAGDSAGCGAVPATHVAGAGRYLPASTAGITLETGATSHWGLDPGAVRQTSQRRNGRCREPLRAAPTVVEVRLPADLVAAANSSPRARWTR